jgi:hypothetical protein
MNTTPLRPKLEQRLGWIILAVLLGGCLLVMRPFVSALLWGMVLSVSSWPLYRRLVQLLGGRRTLAASLMALAMICVILLPFVIVGATLGDNVKELTAAARRWMDAGPPAPPGWLVKVPGVGRQAAQTLWAWITSSGTLAASHCRRSIQPVSGKGTKQAPPNLERYERLVATIPAVERKGVTLPYTSLNGHMFSFLDPTGAVALRLSADDRDAFLAMYGTTLAEQHGRVMQEFVIVPEKEGTYEIPSISFSSFDPATQSQRTDRTPV